MNLKLQLSDEASWVEPIYPIAPKSITLSDLDKFAGPSFVAYALFFRVSESSDPSKHYEHLKKGLSRVLFEIPSLAGKLRKDDSHFFQVEIPQAPKAGTFFGFRDLRGDESVPSFDELASKNFPFVDGVSDGLGALVPESFPNSEDGDPTMMSQLSYLDGGLVLTIGYCHVLGDVVQGWQLGLSWARHTNAVVAESLKLHNGIARPVVEPSSELLVDREMLSRYWRDGSGETVATTTTTTPSEAPKSEVVASDEVEVSANGYKLWETLVPPARLSHSEATSERELRRRTCGMWVLEPAQVQELRSRASKVQGGKLQNSTLDVVTGFLWQRYALAKLPSPKGLSTAEQEEIDTVLKADRIIWFTMNLRGRLNPPLSQDFTPNCVGVFGAELSSDTLFGGSDRTDTDSGVSAAAQAVRHTIDHFDQQGWAKDLRERPSLWPSRLSYPIDFIMTDHRAFGKVAGTHWGDALGEPTALREVTLGFLRPKPGLIYVMPSDKNGCVSFLICSEYVIHQRLSQDPEWTNFASCVFSMADPVSA